MAELQKLGGARVILATAPNAKAISALVDGLSRERQAAGAGRARRTADDQRVAVDHGADDPWPAGTPAQRGIRRTLWNSVR